MFIDAARAYVSGILIIIERCMVPLNYWAKHICALQTETEASLEEEGAHLQLVCLKYKMFVNKLFIIAIV